MNNLIKFYKIASKAFHENQNIVQKLLDIGANKSESIELAYELQAGSYTRDLLQNFETENFRNKKLQEIIIKYSNLKDVNSVCVFGIGEAVNWVGFEGVIDEFYGIELSYSRLHFAKQNLLAINGVKSFNLIKGDAAESLFKDNSFDLCISLHSIEPNGDKQGALMINNIVNSSSKYVLLFEPDYRTAHEEMKTRMKHNSYTCNISDVLEKLDSINIVDKFIIEPGDEKKNLTTCWIVEKKHKKISEKEKFKCPHSGGKLTDYTDMMYSSRAGVLYPKVNYITFLNKKDAVFVGNMGLGQFQKLSI